MLLLIHLIVSLILVAILFPLFGFYSLIVLIGGFFIDLDHIIFHGVKFKSFDLMKAYNYCREITVNKKIKEYKKVIKVFHSVEFVFLIAVFSFYYKIFLILLMGMIIHIIMDLINEYPIFGNLNPYSIIIYVKNVKKYKKE